MLRVPVVLSFRGQPFDWPGIGPAYADVGDLSPNYNGRNFIGVSEPYPGSAAQYR